MLTPLTRAQIASLESATNRYHDDVEQALGYLASRGIAEAVADRYRLGYVAHPLPGHEQFTGRLAIPYLTAAGVVDIRFRALGESDAKYLNRPGVTPTLFNVSALLRPAHTCCVTEGELDAVIAETALGVPAVGVPGVSAWQAGWERLLVDFDRVIVPCDGDEAGHGFGAKLAKLLPNVVAIHLPAGHDVSSLYLQVGVDGLRHALGLG
jgi:DNA primase